MADRFALFVRDDEECKKQKPITRLVLYALAARANETGYCWPSVEQVMSDTGLCRASIFRALTEIREILTVDAPGYKKSNSYIFPFQEKKGRRGIADRAAIGQTKKLSTKGKRVVDNSLSQRPQGSLVETGGGLSQRPEEERGRIQEVSLSLKPSQTPAEGNANVDNSTPTGCAYDGSRKPRTQAEIAKIKFWCKAAGLDEDHTQDFLRINRLARWRQIDATTTVCDLIAGFVLKWRKDDPDGYYYFNDKRKGIVRG